MKFTPNLPWKKYVFFRYKTWLCQQQQLTSDFSNEAEGLLHYVVK